MYSIFKNIVLVSLLGVCCALFAAGEISVQGVLRDPLGTTVEDGYYSINFKLYDVETGGVALWEETQGSVEIQHGVFSVELGTVSSMTDLTFIENYWIGISVESGTEMTPRTKLTTSPYSKAVFGIENVFPSYGSVGVGTTSPDALLEIIENESNSTDDLLHMQNSASATQLRVEDDGTMTIPNGGTLGVGTSAPTAAVHVEASSAGQDMLLIKDSGGVDQVKIDSNGDMTITSDLVVGSSGSINFPDGSSLVSADFGGAASSVTSPSNAEIGADNTGSGAGAVNFNINGVTKASILNNGNAEFGADASVAGNTDIGGALNVTGNAVLGGRDIAADGSKLDGIAAGATNVTNNNQISNGAGYYTNSNYADVKTLTYMNQSSGHEFQVGTPIYLDNNPDNGAASQLRYEYGNDPVMYLLGGNGGQGWSNQSDRRLKQDITNYAPALQKILALRPVTYRWKKYPDEDPFPGFIAQEVQEQFPEFVTQLADEMLGVNYSRLIMPVIKAIQEQQVIIDNQEAEIQSLKTDIQSLAQKIEALERSR